MPKIRDLGINVIPETMRPPEIGPGGGCNAGTYGPNCPATTFPTTTGNCPATTFPTTPWFGCPGTTFPTTGNCPATTFPTTPWYGGGCPGTTFATTGGQPYMADPGCPGTTFLQGSLNCQPPANVPGCPTTTFQQPSMNCYGQPGLSRESIQQLKQQLQQQIAQLDELAKNIGPKTIEEIDAREKQLREELEELARRRQEYKP